MYAMIILFVLAGHIVYEENSIPEQTIMHFEDLTFVHENTFLSWQCAYAEILRYYSSQTLGSFEDSWYFSLHDLDGDGIPELFLVMRLSNGKTCYRFVYSFKNGTIFSLEFEDSMPGGLLLSYQANHTTYTLFDVQVGMGGVIKRLTLHEKIIAEYRGYFRPSEAGANKHNAGYDIRNLSYCWFELYVNAYPGTELSLFLMPASVYDFEKLFGRRENRVAIALIEVSENAINDLFLQCQFR